MHQRQCVCARVCKVISRDVIPFHSPHHCPSYPPPCAPLTKQPHSENTIRTTHTPINQTPPAPPNSPSSLPTHNPPTRTITTSNRVTISPNLRSDPIRPLDQYRRTKKIVWCVYSRSEAYPPLPIPLPCIMRSGSQIFDKLSRGPRKRGWMGWMNHHIHAHGTWHIDRGSDDNAIEIGMGRDLES